MTHFAPPRSHSSPRPWGEKGVIWECLHLFCRVVFVEESFSAEHVALGRLTVLGPLCCWCLSRDGPACKADNLVGAILQMCMEVHAQSFVHPRETVSFPLPGSVSFLRESTYTPKSIIDSPNHCFVEVMRAPSMQVRCRHESRCSYLRGFKTLLYAWLTRLSWFGPTNT